MRRVWDDYVAQHGLPRQNGTVKRPKHLLAVCAIVAAAAAIATAMALGHKPVVFHAFAERDCACGDFHDKVTGLVVRNSFRDLAPERAADSFLASLRANQCSVGNELCDYALQGADRGAGRQGARRERPFPGHR
jgi:hypothetical protein